MIIHKSTTPWIICGIINYGNFSEISGSLTSNGALYRELKKSVPRTNEKGITIQLRSCDKVKARKVYSGVYSIT